MKPGHVVKLLQRNRHERTLHRSPILGSSGDAMNPVSVVNQCFLYTRAEVARVLTATQNFSEQRNSNKKTVPGSSDIGVADLQFNRSKSIDMQIYR